jgi:AraC-like DNA-binding protein
MLAEVAGMSRFYFCHSFKEVTGQTISDYINYIRISMAESKLDNTDLSITDIALSVGFDDINYFSRVYKKHKGISPKAARRNLKF